MTADLTAILTQIAEPGRMLAFCDETDLTGQATTTMVADIHMYVAVVLPSAKYRPLAASLRASLATFGVAEFHATDIVNNGRKSVWKTRDKADRLAALASVCDALCASGAHIYYVHISNAQYDGFVAAFPPGSLDTGHKRGVRTRFRELIADLLDTTMPAIVVADKKSNKAGVGLAKIASGDHLAGGGILLAHSHEVPGLQLADIAAYIVGRYIRRRDGMIAISDEEALEDFDRLIADAVGKLAGRFDSLLTNPPLHQ